MDKENKQCCKNEPQTNDVNGSNNNLMPDIHHPIVRATPRAKTLEIMKSLLSKQHEEFRHLK